MPSEENEKKAVKIKIRSEDPEKVEKKSGKKKKDEVELSEADQALKDNLDLLVERLQDANTQISVNAITALKDKIRSATSSMTSVPKPLKFLKPHYGTIVEFHERVLDADRKTSLADLLSVLSMTMAEEEGKVLEYRLKAGGDFETWGHQYVRHLQREITEKYEHHNTTDEDDEDGSWEEGPLVELANRMVKFYMEHNAEPEACDILLECDKLANISEHLRKDNYERVCLYLISCSAFLPYPEDDNIINICFDIYMQFESYVHAMRMSIKLDDKEKVFAVMKKVKNDKVMRRQLGYVLGWQQFPFSLEEERERAEAAGEEEEDEDDDEAEALTEIISNVKLHEAFHDLARDLDVLEPKSPEDIYKEHLSETKTANVMSARKNLASTYVNAFVNAGFGKDKLMTENDAKWIYQNKDTGMMAAVASLGMIMLWDADSVNVIDKYLDATEDYIKAGARLAVGIACSGMRDEESDIAYAVLQEFVEGQPRDIRMGTILGLGFAYAGQAKEELLETLSPLVEADEPNEITCFAALALGLSYLGTGNDEIVGLILADCLERTAEQLDDPIFLYHCLAMGLLFLGRREDAEATIEAVEALKEINPKLAGNMKVAIEMCSYAGTGNVLKVQEFLRIAGEHPDKKEEDEEDKKKEGDEAKESDKEDEKEKEDEEPPEEKSNFKQGLAVLGIAVVAMGEQIGQDMAMRAFNHLLQYGEPKVRRAVPLAAALISVSHPQYSVSDMLSKLSHDHDPIVGQCAILSLGIIGAGTNNARIATMLRQLTDYYQKEPDHLFCVRTAQGLLHMGKGLMTLNPLHSDRMLVSKVAIAGLLVTLFACIDIKRLFLEKRHYLLYSLVLAMKPRMLVTLDEECKPINVSVRVGEAVDVAGQAGRRKTITGFQTHDTPVLLSFKDRAELATEEYIPQTPVLDGFVILKKNPEYEDEKK